MSFDAWQLIADLRGGVPSKCDGCDKETQPWDLIPISGGEWVCPECCNIIMNPHEAKP